ncbi:MAG: PQQ-dependent sugar dehydrogenase [Planctomycetales bacterium]|nr:PQQ-dependent sugar dehydrogenase [Planctomycetales bacterium]
MNLIAEIGCSRRGRGTPVRYVGLPLFLWLSLLTNFVAAQSYRIERIASGLNQPTYVTQAPGDAANILYFTERTSNTIGGFGAVNDMGKVWRYDVDTQTKTMVLDLSSRTVTNDTGLQTIAFSPDFNTPGTPTYHKMYVSSSEASTTAINRVEEYAMNPDGTFGSGRTILRYDNNKQNNHTVNWIGFDPTATGVETNYLYISTGDGSFGNAYDGGNSPNGRPSQNPEEIAGKFLRVDVSGDSYLGNSSKNYAIPPTNPLPAYNAANPGSTIAGLGEVWLTGVRNGYRASFDTATGDLYYGDVGENAIEEINFIKAGSNASGPPVDLGWPQYEGTSDSNISGAPHTTTNPFTGVTSLDPIQQYTHATGLAVMGGYVYHGPIAELEGKYFYTDFVRSKFWSLAYDRNDVPDGDNGVNTDVTSLWQSLVYDPNDPSYLPSSSLNDLAGLDHVVSFGEDNAGNLYLVDFGNRSGNQNNFDGQYPAAGLGEIFRLTPALLVTLTVDRLTGEMTLSNPTGAAVDLRSYTISSAAGAIGAAAIDMPVTGNFDAPPGGDGSVDANDDWQITSSAGSPYLFAEESLGDAGTLADGQSIALGAGGAWLGSPLEDLQLTVTLGDGSTMPGAVAFVGNGGLGFARSDLNADGTIDAADWPALRDNHLVSLAGLSPVEAYRAGDVDGDGDNDVDDFRLFKADYEAANGLGSFATLGARVPEPATATLCSVAFVLIAVGRRRRGCADAASPDGRRR